MQWCGQGVAVFFTAALTEFLHGNVKSTKSCACAELSTIILSFE